MSALTRVELGEGQVVEKDPGLAVVVGEGGAAVLADVHPVLVGRVEPHRVKVGMEAVDLRPASARRRSENFMFVASEYTHGPRAG